MGENDYINVVIQILARTCSFRDLFLNEHKFFDTDSLLVKHTGELLKKIWNPRQFKGHVSPHEFMQAIITESNGKFTLKKRGDPVVFLKWLLDSLHNAFTKKSTAKYSHITKIFQGELEISEEKEDSSKHIK